MSAEPTRLPVCDAFGNGGGEIIGLRWRFGSACGGVFIGPAIVKVDPVPGAPVLLLSGFDLAPLGYTIEEFFLSGTASSYQLAGAPTADGHWNAVPAGTAPYVTRIVVVRPIDAGTFNGTIVVEWLNVSAGIDASPDWNAVHRLLIRDGYAYVAVSAQKVGVEGGPTIGRLMGTPLKRADPERYAPLSHPGDAFSYDIFSQTGGLLRAPHAKQLLGSLVPKRIIAVGESQSAMYLTTYVNAVDPHARAYDGFLIHSRFGPSAPLDGTSMIDRDVASGHEGVKLRADLRVPVITVITETDLIGSRLQGFFYARQPDAARLRTWEVTGTAHADNYTFGIGLIDSGSAPLERLARGYAPTATVLGAELAKPMNFGPQHHYVVEAAIWSLSRWIETGQAAPNADPIELDPMLGASPTPALDANGLARGGVRTPWVDVPTARLSGVGNSGSPLASLVGTSEPFDTTTLDRLYPGGKSEYLRKFEASLSATIEAGFILPEDRQENLDLAALLYRGSD